MPPEFLESKQITQKSDVYSYSLIAYSIITGREPYDASDFPFCIDKIIKGKRPELKFIENSKFKQFLSKCWPIQKENSKLKQIIKYKNIEYVYSKSRLCLFRILEWLYK